MALDQLVQWVSSVSGQHTVGGGLGGFVKTLETRAKPREAIVNIVVGAIMGFALGDWANALLAQTPIQALGEVPTGWGAGFALGLLGLSLTRYARRVLERDRKDKSDDHRS